MAHSHKLVLRKPPRKDGKCTVILRIIIDRKVIPRSLPYQVYPEHWDTDKQTVNKKAPNYHNLNLYFKKVKADIESAFLKLDLKGQAITPENVLRVFDGKDSTDFIAFAEEELRAQRKILSWNTYRGHESRFSMIKEFAGDKLPIDHITPAFLEDLFNWLRIEKGNNINGAALKLMFIRSYLNKAREKGLTDHYPFLTYKIKSAPPKHAGAFSKEEVERLYNLLKSGELPDHLANALHQALIACYTGFRYSDYHNFNSFDGSQNVLKIKPTKTRYQDREITIPLHPRAKELLAGKFRLISYNRQLVYLKEVAKIAGIEKRITTHSPRHTFAMMLLDQSENTSTIQALMGHTDYRSTLSYINITDKQKEDAISKL